MIRCARSGNVRDGVLGCSPVQYYHPCNFGRGARRAAHTYPASYPRQTGRAKPAKQHRQRDGPDVYIPISSSAIPSTTINSASIPTAPTLRIAARAALFLYSSVLSTTWSPAHSYGSHGSGPNSPK
jgi:hypothetical protein